MTTENLTVAEKLLAAALSLDAGERRSFTAEQLVVAAWEHYPDAFGLRGILDEDGTPRHPDSNRVFAEIMGNKPLRRDGYLDKVGKKTYQLTEAGRLRAAAVRGVQPDEGPRRALSRNLQNDLRRVYRSRAAAKCRDGHPENTTFNDACGFWGISPRSSANDLKAKLAHTGAVIEAARDFAAAGAVLLDPSTGLAITGDDLDSLETLSRDLETRFHAELAVIRRRVDERTT